jgi:hypothetical protein
VDETVLIPVKAALVDIDKNKLQATRSYKAGEEPAYDRANGQRVYEHCDVPFGGI